jgi:hypothetical protein
MADPLRRLREEKKTREERPQNGDNILQIIPSVLFLLAEINIMNHALKIALEITYCYRAEF